MNRQVLKLLVILNVCSWLTISFGIWQYSSGFPQQLVSTIIVLGIMAVLANLIYWMMLWAAKKKVAQTNNRWVQAFILLSTVVQLLLIFFFLQ